MNDLPQFRRSDAETFEAAWNKAVRAVRERAPLTKAEIAAGWREDRLSLLRRNVRTGVWDDSGFLHMGPKRPS
jgi:hypothetical protein